MENIASQIINWIKTYAENARVKGLVIGVSGGVDSAVVSTLCARTIDEGSMDEKSGMNFSEYMAILSGNTDLLDKARLEKKVAALESERKSFNRAKHETQNRLLEMTNQLAFDRAVKEKMSYSVVL